MKTTFLILVTVAVVGEMISFASAASGTNLGTSWECNLETGRIIASGKHLGKTCNTYCIQTSVPKAGSGYCKPFAETGYCYCNWL